MAIVKAAIQHVNPGQVPVLAADQPLFALAREIQWTWPATHGEHHCDHVRRSAYRDGCAEGKFHDKYTIIASAVPMRYQYTW